MPLILSTSSGTTAVATTVAPPSFSDEEFTTDTALGPLQVPLYKLLLRLKRKGVSPTHRKDLEQNICYLTALMSRTNKECEMWSRY